MLLQLQTLTELLPSAIKPNLYDGLYTLLCRFCAHNLQATVFRCGGLGTKLPFYLSTVLCLRVFLVSGSSPTLRLGLTVSDTLSPVSLDFLKVGIVSCLATEENKTLVATWFSYSLLHRNTVGVRHALLIKRLRDELKERPSRRLVGGRGQEHRNPGVKGMGRMGSLRVPKVAETERNRIFFFCNISQQEKNKEWERQRGRGGCGNRD